jgi:transcriptional antiterminator RfaH
MPRQWFVATTHQAQEKRAKSELENQKFETYLPMCVAEWAKAPKVKPFLPSYIFIGLDPVCERWRAVYSTLGVKSVISSGERPQPVADWIIDSIKQREVYGLVRLPPPVSCRFKKGDVVKLKGNPVDAIFNEVKGSRRAEIFISLLGRSNRLIVPLSKIVTLPSMARVVAVA